MVNASRLRTEKGPAATAVVHFLHIKQPGHSISLPYVGSFEFIRAELSSFGSDKVVIPII